MLNISDALFGRLKLRHATNRQGFASHVSIGPPIYMPAQANNNIDNPESHSPKTVE